MKEVQLIFRKQMKTVFSIEYLFHNLHQELNNQVPLRVIELPHHTSGLLSVVKNIYFLLRKPLSIAHITGDCYYAALGCLFSKQIITYHDLSFLDRTKGLRRLFLKTLWVTWPVRLANRITTVSETTRRALMEVTNVDPGKIKVIPNFIDPIYQPVVRNFNTQLPRLLQIGTDFNKNIPNLVRALSGIPCTLVIVGRLRKEQIDLLKDHGIVYENKSLLSLQELHAEYLAADLLVFASTVEGFGMPILEAQACSLPVVTSNCSSMPEVASDGAELVNPNCVDSIRKGILTVIKDAEKRERLVVAGYQNIGQYQKSKIASAYLSVYKELM